MRWLLLWLFCALPASADVLRLAVATSVENSGLAAVLLPAYEAATGDELHAIIVGTGRALSLGAAGDVDAVLTHAPEAEEAAVVAGDFTHRREIMFNEFVLIGPANDPAQVADAVDITDAFTRLAATRARFASRGDESGTHRAEQRIWAAARIDPTEFSGRWYRETGTGMGATLNTAVAMDAYVLSDIATWRSFGNKRDFAVLFSGDPALFNQYAYLPVSEARHPHVARAAAERLEAWLAGPGQVLIAQFRVGGEALFSPNAR